MLIWTPDNSALWFARPETDTSVNEVISISSDDAVVEKVEFSIDSDYELPKQVIIEASNSGVTLTAPDLEGLFPIIAIRYLRHGVAGECYHFDDLPADAEDVLEYRKNPSRRKHFYLTVTATESALSPTSSGTETKIFEFAIDANYTPGRDRLVEEVNARS